MVIRDRRTNHALACSFLMSSGPNVHFVATNKAKNQARILLFHHNLAALWRIYAGSLGSDGISLYGIWKFVSSRKEKGVSTPDYVFLHVVDFIAFHLIVLATWHSDIPSLKADQRRPSAALQEISPCLSDIA